MKYELEKNKIFNEWIVFERHGSLLIEVHRDRLKKDCNEWINKQQRKRKKKCN